MIQIQAWQVDFHLGKIDFTVTCPDEPVEGDSLLIHCPCESHTIT